MSGTVLIVDDDAGARAIARGVLERHGYQVHEAATAAAALEGASMRPLDLVLADLAMPGIDRPELVRRLRQPPMPPPILALSPVPDGEGPASGSGATEVFGYLPRPFTCGQLVAACQYVASTAEATRLAVSRVIERRREQRRELLLPAVILSSNGTPVARCLIFNLSLSGAELVLDAALRLGFELTLSFQVAGRRDPFQRSAYVRWSKPPRLGVSFIKQGTEDRSLLARVLGLSS